MPVKSENGKQSWDDYYRGYQRALASRYVLPVLASWNVALEGMNVLEVGCGDGGVSAEFYERGCRVTMMDVDDRLVDIARQANTSEGVEAAAYSGDVYDEQGEFYRQGPFDLVLFRDVLEHLADPVGALNIVQKHMTERGRILIIFPPYYSPYGAHQQILPRKKWLGIPYNRLPYIQLLPRRVFLSIVDGDTAGNAEVKRLRDVRLTLGKFERAVARAGMRIAARKLYHSRPTFALRYGMPVIGAPLLGEVPGVRELTVTAGYFLLENAT